MYLLAGQTQTYFVYAGRAAWRLAQEYDSPTKIAATDPAKDSALDREYVYGNYIDEVVQMAEGINGYGSTVTKISAHAVPRHEPRHVPVPPQRVRVPLQPSVPEPVPFPPETLP